MKITISWGERIRMGRLRELGRKRLKEKDVERASRMMNL
jgi:hypothetical protein